jgi:hypothetical protein
MAYEHAILKLTDASDVIISSDGERKDQSKTDESEVKLHGFTTGFSFCVENCDTKIKL